MTTKRKYIHLIYGYIHNQERKGTTDIITDGIIQIIVRFYDKLIKFDNDKYNKSQFKMSSDRTIIEGNGGCNGYMIYADISFNPYGYKKGIHFWSVMALKPKQEIKGKFSECFQSIGVCTNNNQNINSNHFPSHKNGAICSSYFKGHRGHWEYNQIITVILNCNQWITTFYKNSKLIKQEKIKPNLGYYFALSCCGSANWTKVKVVETPTNLYHAMY